ncbi:uncharacterized protein LOC123531137 [Mercenaria mercenaria]|uniref:uncharacterized protein LOC123531137 n=1 Tax=Mercenaria mercenaria TaxID=6596 RepID=UPI00234E73A7|nr:uncharacterized protein LOC123531137 [Mercenaria mercenaria]
MADSFQKSIEYAKKSLKIAFEFSDKQLEAMESLYNLRDTLAVLPTGSGKSVIFQVLPWLLQKPLKADKPLVVIIISPLNSLMQDQVTSLCEKGIPACFLNTSATKVTSFEQGADNV